MKEHQQTFWYGLIEDNNDPKQIGRCRIRVLGVHDPDPEKQPVEDLPWAHVLQIGGAGSGLGFHSVPEISTDVLVTFLDPETKQQPIVLGCLNTVHGGGQGGSNYDADGNPLSGGTASENDVSLNPVEWDGEMIFKPEWFTCLGVSQSNAENLAKAYSKWWSKIGAPKDNYEQMARIIGCNYGETGGKFIGEREKHNYSYKRACEVFKSYRNNPNLKAACDAGRVFDLIYANREGNGNYASGDGMKYRGGGMIQLTFKNGYQKCAAALGLSGPEELASKITETEYAVASSVWFWWKSGRSSPPGKQNSMTSSLRQVGNEAAPGEDAKRIAAYNKVRVQQGKA